MKLFILGATGSTGRHILDLAVARGHEVTAFVRSPQKITRSDVKIVKGDPLNAVELADAMRGHDAVLTALGPRFPEAFRPHTLLGDAAASTTAAMKAAGVPRLAVVSAALLFPEKGVRFAFFRWLLKQHIRDLTTMETVIQATPLEWIIARPPRLVENGGERYRKERDRLPENGFSMSFRAVAAFLLDALEAHAHAREIVGLAA
jgi:putative NADH-flavin reductase